MGGLGQSGLHPGRRTILRGLLVSLAGVLLAGLVMAPPLIALPHGSEAAGDLTEALRLNQEAERLAAAGKYAAAGPRDRREGAGAGAPDRGDESQ